MSQLVEIQVTVNGMVYNRTVEPRLLLSDFLRHDLKLTGTHVGCEHGSCGACTVMLRSSFLAAAPSSASLSPTAAPPSAALSPTAAPPSAALSPTAAPPSAVDHTVESDAEIHDLEAVRSCIMFAVQAHGHEITTVEGLGDPQHLHPIQQAFWEKHGLQCGYCTPGFLLTLIPYLRDNPNPTEAQIREAISGNICRCTGYQNIVDAALMAAELLQAEAS